jgi:hypothetical protein
LESRTETLIFILKLIKTVILVYYAEQQMHCAFVGLDNKLHKLHDIYIKLVILVFNLLKLTGYVTHQQV